MTASPRASVRLVEGRDFDVVAGQLGRAPRAMSRVAARCPFGFPAVVETLPYDRMGAPFPTLYYLTCPTCVRAVSRLESAGGVAAWSARLCADAALARSAAAAGAAARRRRRELLRRYSLVPLDGGASLAGGVAGVAEVGAVKCLHAHVAHALARPRYALGAAILAELGPAWCDDERCAAFTAAPAEPMKVGVVDLGTNTCRLLLAEVGEGEAVRPHTRLATVVRLGQGVDRHGRLHPDAVERTRACLGEYALRLEAYGPARRLLVATSVLRDAADGRAFLTAVEGELCLPCRVLSGGEEAALAFRGGTAELAAAGPILLVDIGGGSMELAVGSPGLPPAFVRSLDIGVVRLTERFLSTDPPTPRELEDLTAFVAAAVAGAVAKAVAGGAPAAVRGAGGVAGTFATLAAHKLGLRTYRPELVHGHVLSVADLEAAIRIFRRLTNAERGRLPGVQRGREDVILAGAVIAREVCRAFGLGEIRCSEADILEGAALALADGSLLPD